jgi:hypothetical protein
MMPIETDPRAKVVRGIVNRDEATMFDSWICDTRREGYGTKNNHIGLGSQMRFFSGSASDPRRGNHLFGGCLPSDNTFRITHVGIHVSFSDSERYVGMMRSSFLRVNVGDRYVLTLHGNLLAQTHVEHLGENHPDPAESGLRLWFELRRPIAIPPRQGFDVIFEMAPALCASLESIARERNSFGMIKLMLKGPETRPVFEDELTDEQREKMAKQHEEFMRQEEALRNQAAVDLEADELRHYEDMAFRLSAVSGADIKPEHVAQSYELNLAEEMAISAIGGGGHPGGVPPFDGSINYMGQEFGPMEFGVKDELVVGKEARGFGDSARRPIDLEALKAAAHRIARERMSEGKPLDESYRKEVAAAIGIDDFESAVPPEEEF